ncbi:MAG TPA: zf-HC2 domain-containing protein [Armatimonadetes bacterium]|nr:zf-HC2 domain-containing protein [Armatimonadota bacterium]
MKCRKAQSLFTAYEYGWLSEQQRGQLEEHIQRCERCQRAWERHRMITAHLQPPPLQEPPRDIWMAIEKELTSSPIPERAWRWMPLQWRLNYIIPAIAIVMLGVCFGLLLTRPRHTLPPAPNYIVLCRPMMREFIYQHASLEPSTLSADKISSAVLVMSVYEHRRLHRCAARTKHSTQRVFGKQ